MNEQEELEDDEHPNSRSNRVGQAYHQQVDAALKQDGWTIVRSNWREPRCGIEIDIVAIDPEGVETWIECKGSVTGSRPGAKRTDSVKKFIGDCALIYALYEDQERHPYVLISSDLPESGSGHRQLQLAVRLGWCTLGHLPMKVKFLEMDEL